MRALSTLLLVAFATNALPADEAPSAAPPAERLDEASLAAIAPAVEALIQAGEIPGAAVAVAHRGKPVYLRSFGTWQDDTVVRIYSMSKPITVVAALMLVEEGKVGLDDPVSKYVPSFADAKVEGSEEAHPAPTVRQLMQHTAGLTYGVFGNTSVDRAYRAAEILSPRTPLADMATKVGAMPLLFPPGDRWHYSVSIDVLARVVEAASGKSFDVFLSERLFKPLAMGDTAFFVPDAKIARFVPCVRAGGDVLEAAETSPFRTKPAFLSGGGGLVSTLSDYLAFAMMLQAGGTRGDVRFLAPETVRLMSTNLLPAALVPIHFAGMPLPGQGFGLGVSVRVEDGGVGTRIGAYGWGGAASTFFTIWPSDEVVIVTMTQRMPLWTGLDRTVKALVDAALGAAADVPVPAK